MSRKIESGRIYRAAKKDDHVTVFVAEFVSADSPYELAEEIAVRRIKNNQVSAEVSYINATSAFIEFQFQIGE